MSESKERTSQPGAAADIGNSVAAVVDAALGVGASLARAFAQATSPGKPIDPVPASTAPIQAIVRYSATGIGNLAALLISGAGSLRKSTGGATSSARAGAGSAGPRVRPGATLRVPLSVENPGDRPMLGLSPRLRAVRIDGKETSAVVSADAVKFAPGLFEVAPRDFEKLTVIVPVPEDAPEGNYEVVFALGPTEPDLQIAFTVVKAEAGAV